MPHQDHPELADDSIAHERREAVGLLEHLDTTSRDDLGSVDVHVPVEHLRHEGVHGADSRDQLLLRLRRIASLVVDDDHDDLVRVEQGPLVPVRLVDVEQPVEGAAKVVTGHVEVRWDVEARAGLVGSRLLADPALDPVVDGTPQDVLSRADLVLDRGLFELLVRHDRLGVDRRGRLKEDDLARAVATLHVDGWGCCVGQGGGRELMRARVGGVVHLRVGLAGDDRQGEEQGHGNLLGNHLVPRECAPEHDRCRTRGVKKQWRLLPQSHSPTFLREL